ncbi:hypothetical protein HCH54_007403 [Aspergillus fumigatus]
MEWEPTRWNHQSTATTEFIFVDGLDPCPPDREVKSLWPGGPYLCYYTYPSHPTPEQWARGGKEEHDLAILQRYDPRTMSLRINIPILHVAGKRDPFYQKSDLLAGLCSANASSVIHGWRSFCTQVYAHHSQDCQNDRCLSRQSTALVLRDLFLAIRFVG